MKSKISLVMSVVFVALMFSNLATAQQVRATKVNLPCKALQTGAKKGVVSWRFSATNDTGAWLAQGTTINFRIEGTGFAYNPWPYVSTDKTVLDGMVPVSGSATLAEYQFKYSDIRGPFTCQAWYLK